jgi:hypothetical protein
VFKIKDAPESPRVHGRTDLSGTVVLRRRCSAPESTRVHGRTSGSLVLRNRHVTRSTRKRVLWIAPEPPRGTQITPLIVQWTCR